jgi:hypothetical protein
MSFGGYRELVKSAFTYDLNYFKFLVNILQPYWQKYAMGINMTVIECDPTQQNNCSIPIPLHDQKLYTAIDRRDVCFLIYFKIDF